MKKQSQPLGSILAEMFGDVIGGIIRYGGAWVIFFGVLVLLYPWVRTHNSSDLSYGWVILTELGTAVLAVIIWLNLKLPRAFIGYLFSPTNPKQGGVPMTKEQHALALINKASLNLSGAGARQFHSIEEVRNLGGEVAGRVSELLNSMGRYRPFQVHLSEQMRKHAENQLATAQSIIAMMMLPQAADLKSSHMANERQFVADATAARTTPTLLEERKRGEIRLEEYQGKANVDIHTHRERSAIDVETRISDLKARRENDDKVARDKIDHSKGETIASIETIRVEQNQLYTEMIDLAERIYELEKKIKAQPDNEYLKRLLTAQKAKYDNLDRQTAVRAEDRKKGRDVTGL